MDGVNVRIVKRDGGAGRIEVHFDRVAVWTLIFTNVFFLSYFFAKMIWCF